MQGTQTTQIPNTLGFTLLIAASLKAVKTNLMRHSDTLFLSLSEMATSPQIMIARESHGVFEQG